MNNFIDKIRLLQRKHSVKKWIISERQRYDLEMLATGGFHPLTGFLSQQDYEQVLHQQRLSSGELWPMPITLDVSDDFAATLEIGEEISLCDTDNSILAFLTLKEKWQPNKLAEAAALFGTSDTKHPGVNYLLHSAGNWYLSGALRIVKTPSHFTFSELRLSPQELKKQFSDKNYQHIVGFQTRNPIHRAHLELTLRAAETFKAHILLHPVVGLTMPGDIDYFTRVTCYQKVLKYYPKENTTLSLLPLAMRMAGPKEALWHALIRKNYGCTHFIIGRDHAGPGSDSNGKPFYDPYAAQQLALQHQDEIGIKIVTFHEMIYIKEKKAYSPANEVAPNETALTISGTELRKALLNEQTLPDWFSFPEVMQELRNSYLPKHKKGFTLFFTGLSGAGKTTLANAIQAELMKIGKRNISLLDGDIIRRILNPELGFSKADRNMNIQRIGFVAKEITRTGGIAICSAIAPYEEARNKNRRAISELGGYIEIYVATSIQTCESRDTKGLYASKRKQQLQGLTGVDDLYEAPKNAEIVIDTTVESIEQSVGKIMQYLRSEGYIAAEIAIKNSLENTLTFA